MSDEEADCLLQKVQEAISLADKIRMSTHTDVEYVTLQRSGFRRKDGWRRKYTLSDARKDAESVASNLRRAWEILDPSMRTTFVDSLKEIGVNRQRVRTLRIREIQSELRLLLDEDASEVCQDSEALKAECIEMTKNGRRTDAVKLYRSKTGLSLREAIQALGSDGL